MTSPGDPADFPLQGFFMSQTGLSTSHEGFDGERGVVERQIGFLFGTRACLALDSDFYAIELVAKVKTKYFRVRKIAHDALISIYFFDLLKMQPDIVIAGINHQPTQTAVCVTK